MRQRAAAFVVLVTMACAPSAWATTYAIDPDHTTVGFKIRHLFSNVTGSFTQLEGRIDYVPDHPEQWNVSATIQAASIDTRVGKRDNHLRSADFLDVAQFPTITFTSTEVTEATATSAKLHGTLTIHGVSQPVVLDLAIHGEGKDPWGNVRSGFSATTTINRKDFGLVWNQTLETGQLLVGDAVDIALEIEGIAQ